MQTGKTCDQKSLRSSTINCSYLLMLREVNVRTHQIWPWSAASSGKAFWREVLMCPLSENWCSWVVLRVECQTKTKSGLWATPDCDATMPTVEHDSLHDSAFGLSPINSAVCFVRHTCCERDGWRGLSQWVGSVNREWQAFVFLNCPIFRTFSAGPSRSQERWWNMSRKRKLFTMSLRHAYWKMWLIFYCTFRPTVCATAGDRKENCWQVLNEVYAISSTPNLIGPMPLSSSRFRRCACANCSEYASVGFCAQLPQLSILAPPPSGSMNIFVTYSESRNCIKQIR